MAIRVFILSTLIASIVNFGLTSVQVYKHPMDQVSTSKVNDPSHVRENFMSLFDSIVKNNASMSNSYHKLLKHEVTKEQQSIDTMKKEFQIARDRNFQKKQNFYHKINLDEYISLTKRESNGGIILTTSGDNFESTILGGKVHVDKTHFIRKLLTYPPNSKGRKHIFFLSRPRKFGKSFLVDMLNSFFSNKISLFEHTKIIQDNEQIPEFPWGKYGVILIKFDRMLASTANQFEKIFVNKLKVIGQKYGMPQDQKMNSPQAMEDLLEAVNNRYPNKVVLLVDEYDAHYSELVFKNYKEAEKILYMMKNIYAVVKDKAHYITFGFLTGCSKMMFIEMSSGALSIINDISFNDLFSDLLGFTGSEIRKYFGKKITEVLLENDEDQENEIEVLKEDVFENLTQLYDGYTFSPNGERMYNPFSVIECLDQTPFSFKNHWAEFAVNTRLIFTVIDHFPAEFFRFSMCPNNIVMDKSELIGELDIMKFNKGDFYEAVKLFYQGGFITVTEFIANKNQCILSFPNIEIQTKLKEILRNKLLEPCLKNAATSKKMKEYLQDRNYDQFFSAIEKSLLYFYKLETKYNTVFAYYMENMDIDAMLDKIQVNIKSETSDKTVVRSKPDGKAVTSRKTTTNWADYQFEDEDTIYIFKFKMKRNTEDPMKQCWEKYAVTHVNNKENKKIICIGVWFNPGGKGYLGEDDQGDKIYKYAYEERKSDGKTIVAEGMKIAHT